MASVTPKPINAKQFAAPNNNSLHSLSLCHSAPLPSLLLHIFNQIQMTWQSACLPTCLQFCSAQPVPIPIPISVLIIAKYELTVNAKLLFTLQNLSSDLNVFSLAFFFGLASAPDLALTATATKLRQLHLRLTEMMAKEKRLALALALQIFRH